MGKGWEAALEGRFGVEFWHNSMDEERLGSFSRPKEDGGRHEVKE